MYEYGMLINRAKLSIFWISNNIRHVDVIFFFQITLLWNGDNIRLCFENMLIYVRHNTWLNNV